MSAIKKVRRSASYRTRSFPLLIAATQVGLFSAGLAQAQTPVLVAQAGDAPNGSPLEEIVVTATKRSEVANKVPLSIVALPQSALIERDLRSAQDIARAVPGLFISSSNNSTGPSVAIRGVASAIGAPTTAIYLDDIPLQKRLVNGTSSGSGSPFPQLYDLDRVEVLKGPQGTLYGESSEGGAIRFITPQPSLTDFTAKARTELSGTEHGGLNYEEGVALGGPIVPDILGFRASLWDRHDSGYIDHRYLYTGQTLGEGTNSENRWEGRLAVAWAPTDQLKITAAYYIARDHFGDADTYTENLTSPINVPAHGSVPAHVYGPYPYYGPYETSANCNIGQNYVNAIKPCYQGKPRTTTLNIPSISIDYDFDDFSIHSSTAYATDVGKGDDDAAFGDLPGLQGGVPIVPFTLPSYSGDIRYNNSRNTATEELRATSAPNDGPWTWVAGVFASNQQTHQRSQDYSVGFDAAVQALTGQTVAQHYNAPTSADGGISQRDQHVRETEYAAFGEATYQFFDDLKAIVGLRVARDQIKYYGSLEGPFFGFADPTFTNGGLSGGDQFATAILPKFSLQYQLSEDQMIYATASKGERVGGVNTGPYYTKCATTFQSLGITGTPATYDPDTLWNYELGTKLRLFGGKAQVNASLFYIDWSNVQVSYSLPQPCGFGYVANAGGAVSKGGDVDAQFELLEGLTASLNIAYTDATYTTSVLGPAPKFTQFIAAGDPLAVPPLSIDIGVRYALPILAEYQPYIRADYQYNSKYNRGFGPGDSTYNPFTYVASQTQYVTARLGITVDDFDVALFVDNLFNSQDVLTRSGGGACASKTSCAPGVSFNPIFTDSTFRPRTFGLNVNYKFGSVHEEKSTATSYVPPPIQAPAPAPHSYLVFFDFNKSDLTSQATQIVDTAAKNAGPAKVTQLTVTGHTDTVGSDAYNLRLSRRRAESVAAQLEKDGIPSSEIEIVAKGKRDLLVPTADGVREPQNRRVQIVYSGGQGGA